MSFALHNKEAKLLPPDTFLSCKNAFAAGALPRTPLGELTAPLVGNGEVAPERGGKGRGGVGVKGREGEGLSFPE